MKTVLVTGSNRSGTTWFGTMLSLSGKFLEVYEPFNHLIYTPKFFSQAPFADHYHYVLQEESSRVKRYVNDRIIYSALTTQSTYTEGLGELPKLDQIVKLYRGLNNLISLIIQKKRLLIKDPIGLLSADWLAREYGAQVIVLIRHPAAYVSSIKRLNWDMSLTSFSTQKEFMATLPEDLVSQINQQVNDRPPCDGYNLEDAALSWKIFHYVIHAYQQLYPDWLFLKHEDLCRNFLQGFDHLYSWLALPFTEEIKNTMQQYCNRQDAVELGTNVHVLKRDSSIIPNLWRKNLNQDEVDRIREITEDIANFFYDDVSWK